jgi:hypothetical protein
MSDQPEQSEASELLRAMGEVPPPEQLVLDDARAVLWSAIAIDPLGIEAQDHQQDHQRTTRRRQANQSPDQRRMSMGGGGADSSN